MANFTIRQSKWKPIVEPRRAKPKTYRQAPSRKPPRRGWGWVGFKALLQLANFTLGPDATLNTETHKNSVRIKATNSVNASKRKHKNQINHYNKQRRVLMANSTVCQSKWKPIVEPPRAKPKTYRQVPTHWLKFYEEAVIESPNRRRAIKETTRHAVCRIISRL